MIGRKTLLAAMATMAALGIVAPAAQAAPAASGDKVTLVRADKSTVTVPWQTSADGVRYAVDPQNKSKSAGVENAAVVVEPASVMAGGCPGGRVCIFEHRDYGGNALGLLGGYSIDLLGGYACPGCTSSHHPASNGTFDDQMTSWSNVSGWNYCWTFDPSGTGERHPMYNGISVNVVTDHENDEATSLVTC